MTVFSLISQGIKSSPESTVVYKLPQGTTHRIRVGTVNTIYQENVRMTALPSSLYVWIYLTGLKLTDN